MYVSAFPGTCTYTYAHFRLFLPGIYSGGCLTCYTAIIVHAIRVPLCFVCSLPPGMQLTSEQLQWAFILSRIGFSIPTFQIIMFVEFIEWLNVAGSGFPTHMGDTYSWHNPLCGLFVSCVTSSIDWSNNVPSITRDRVSHTACKFEFRHNIHIYSWSVVLFYYIHGEGFWWGRREGQEGMGRGRRGAGAIRGARDKVPGVIARGLDMYNLTGGGGGELPELKYTF